MPDDENVGNASNGVPAPLLSRLLVSVSSKKASQDHDEVGDDSHEGVGPIDSGQEAEVCQ